MMTFKLCRVGACVRSVRYLDGAEQHSIVYATLTGSSADRRRQFRAMSIQFNSVHG